MPKLKERTASDYERLFTQHIKPALGCTSVSKINHDDANRFPRVDGQGRGGERIYAVATLRALLNFAEKLELRTKGSNPASGVKMFKEYARERFLSEAEIAKAAEAIEQAERGMV